MLSSFRCQRRSKGPAHAVERLAKTAVHELGHTFGLEHCPSRGCLMEDGGGSVLTLTHQGSERVFPNYNVMGVAKAALELAVRYLAAELGPRNIRVNAISAGPIKTLAAAGIAGFSVMLQAHRDRAPLRRGVDPGEVADTGVFLLGQGGRGITGEVIFVDGGYNIVGL